MTRNNSRVKKAITNLVSSLDIGTQQNILNSLDEKSLSRVTQKTLEEFLLEGKEEDIQDEAF